MDYSRLGKKADWAVDCIDLPEAAASVGARWEDHQLGFLNYAGRFAIDVKARQIAWSFTAALDAIVDSRFNPGLPYLFVSINLDEAKEKIRYARAILAGIDNPDARPVVVADSQTTLEFSDGTRLISFPCRPPRGKARARIYLDEMAHYKAGLDRQIYSGALPATVRSDGYIRIGSSTMGATGLFWEIFTENLRKYPGFKRRLIPWWDVRALCIDVAPARLAAPTMLTEERVRLFGTPALIEIFENMFLEDFQQEYECAWVDEATAWITWEIIKRNQDDSLLWWHAKSVDDALLMIPLIAAAIEDGLIESTLTGGVDVGRKRHLTEFMALGRGTAAQMPLRFSISLDRVEYDDQERCFQEVIDRLPFTQVLIDQNGIGAQLAENLKKKQESRRGWTSLTRPRNFGQSKLEYRQSAAMSQFH